MTILKFIRPIGIGIFDGLSVRSKRFEGACNMKDKKRSNRRSSKAFKERKDGNTIQLNRLKRSTAPLYQRSRDVILIRGIWRTMIMLGS
uniref:Uncharacterized protein n=1 Tax=Megaselia scalaris TaxID=36166 RepID=T1GDF2_MEGSC